MEFQPNAFTEGKIYSLTFTQAFAAEFGEGYDGEYIFRGTQFSPTFNGGYRFVFSRERTRHFIFPFDLQAATEAIDSSQYLGADRE